jgi:hypothetical protein
VGNALSFGGAGASQYVVVTNFGNIIPTNEITVECWADVNAVAAQAAFALNPDQFGNRFAGLINYNNQGGAGGTYFDFGNIFSGGGRIGPVAAPANSLNNWTHYAFVSDQAHTSMSIYTNGVLLATQGTMSPFVRGAYNLQLGGLSGAYLSGQLDEFRVWSVAMTQAQIQSNMFTPLQGTEPNLVVYYRFDSASGTVATNSCAATGATYNGTLVNSPAWVASGVPTYPTALTTTAAGVSTTNATLNGTVNSNGLATSWYFQYGLTTNYTAATVTNILTTSSVSATVSNLAPGTTYHFQLVATNVAGANAGGDVTFTTLPVPVVTAINPNTGLSAGGTVVTITGSNFSGATSVTFGGMAATAFSVSNSTTITATTPYNPLGTVNVAVTTSLGTGTGTNLFTYTAIYPMASARLQHSATLLPNGLVLVAGGYNGGAPASAELYNPAAGAWTAAGSLASARYQHTATLLPNGLVLVAGGVGSSGALATAELYNPATGTWTTTGSMVVARHQHTTTLLANGLVLVAGGQGNSGQLASAELYNPATGTWTATGSLATGRYQHTATLLTNGLVLVAGGLGSVGALLSAEMYNPATGTWTAANSLTTARDQHTATLLPSGLVLVAGGLGNSGTLVSAELYNPATGTWAAANSLATGRAAHTATLLPNGQLLVAGGQGNSGSLASAELYNPATGTWTATNSLITARYFDTATLLPNGQLLVAGGQGNSGALATAELYYPNPTPGAWTATASMATNRSDHTTTLLPSGLVLVVGGSGTNSAELYHPATGTWQAASSLATNRSSHTATLLPSGLVLVAGGAGASGLLASGELYNPATGAWRAAGSLASARYQHTATLLPNGQVLVAAGGGTGGSSLGSAELYNPATGTWTVTGSLNAARNSHTATLLPNGLVLVAGGFGTSVTLASAELYNPATGTWTATGSLNIARRQHTATLLPNGLVLVAGGNNGLALASAELYNPATGTWTVTGSLNTARNSPTATLLPNGLVLVAGGGGTSVILANAELYNPATGTWTVTGSLANARYVHTATLLPNGLVLVAGGQGSSGLLASTELYNVGLGFNAAWQPQATTVASSGNGGLILTGSIFRGISSASGGNGSQDSPTSYPLVQVRRLDNEQSVFLLSDPASSVSASAFASQALPALGQGWFAVTVFANGIPSVSQIFSLPWPGIDVFQPTNIEVGNGGSRTIFATTKTPASLTFTLFNNNFGANLTGLTITTNGANVADFAVTAGPTTPLPPGGSTTFTVQFSPITPGAGSESASLQLSAPGTSTPYIISLAGQRLSYTNDSSGDGLSDGAKFDLAPLGFNWQSNQTSLVNTLFTYANEIGLYTANQVQALNVGSPLLTLDPGNGLFTLTIGVQQATNLSGPFLSFPMNGPGASTSIDPQGRLQFQFPGSNNAAFFRLLSQ